MYSLYETQFSPNSRKVDSNDIIKLFTEHLEETKECKRLFDEYYNAKPMGFVKRKAAGYTDSPDVIKKRTLKEKYSKYKQSNLPFVQFNCITHPFKTHDIEFISDYSGDMILDYDELGPDDLSNIIKVFKEIPYTKKIFHSPSGMGIKCLVKIKKLDISKHDNNYFKEYFSFVSNYYNEQIKKIIGKDITADLSGCNSNRGCYIPYDIFYYYNDKAKILEYSKKIEIEKKNRIDNNNRVSTSDVNLLRKYINFIYTNKLPIVPNYDEWIRVGFSIKKYIEDKNEAKEMFNKVSMFSNGYINKIECDKKYEALCNGKSQKEISIRYLDNLIRKYTDYQIILTKDESDTLKTRIYSLLDVHYLMKQDDWEIYENEINRDLIISWDNRKSEHGKREEFTLEASGNDGIVKIRKYFLENYNLDLKSRNDIDYVIFGYERKTINPPLEVLKKNINDSGEEEFIKMCKLIPTDYSLEDLSTILKRYLLGVINNLTYDRETGRKYDEILILRSEDGEWGKTFFIRKFLFSPLLTWKGKFMFNESANFKKNNKDLMYADLSTVVNYKPEISKLITKDPNSIKDYLSTETYTIRRSYRANMEDFLSRTSFIADTNDEYYLPNDSNLRRFLQINITGPLQFKVRDDTGKFVTKTIINWEKIWGWLYHLHTIGKTYETYSVPEIFKNRTDFISTDYDDAIIREVIKPQRDDNDTFTIDELLVELRRNGINIKDTSHESIRVKLKNLKVKKDEKTLWDSNLKANVRKYKGWINCLEVSKPKEIPVAWN